MSFNGKWVLNNVLKVKEGKANDKKINSNR